MNRHGIFRFLTFACSFVAGLSMALSSFHAASEDIDIFSVDIDQTVNTPNVLIILDNSANWSRQAQQWPSAATQGQSEVRAIKEVIVDELPEGAVNVGLLEYRTDGSSGNNDNGYVRYHIRPMEGANKTDFGNILFGGATALESSIFSNINAPIEKRNQGNPLGNLMWEAYNYLGAFNSIASPGTAGEGTPSLADPAAYNSQYDAFRSPLTSTDSCTRTIIIFIGNNTQQGPTADSQDNENALDTIGGTTDQLPFAEFEVTTTIQTAFQGYTTACYESISACTSAENAACTDPETGGLDSCECIEDAVNPASECTEEQFTVYGRNTTRTQTSQSTTGPTLTDTGEAIKCQNNDPGTLSCPSTNTQTVAGPGENEETDITTSWQNCDYVEDPNSCGNNDNKSRWIPKGDKTITETVFSLSFSDTSLGLTGSCSVDAPSCDTSVFSDCTDGSFDSCFCDTPTSSSGCTSTRNNYQVRGTFTSTDAVATGNFVPAPSGPFMADEWARHMRNVGVPLPGGSVNTLVTTYTIDVFNAQQHQDFSGLLFNMARVGGGKYFQAKDENQLKAALREILTEVQAVNSAFSSASLPVNATNRAQNENQVFIGLFSPDRQKAPLWFGNLKRYQLIQNGPSIELGDVNEDPAVNEQTGFVTECAVSFWTTDSGDYWSTVGTDDPPAESTCGKPDISIHSDLPDGPFVQKGGAAEVLRKGNDVNASADSDGNFPVDRNILTLSSGSLVDFTASNSGGFFDPTDQADVNIVNFIRGEDVKDEDGDAVGSTPPARAYTEPRSTIHGDVVHSRPQPLNYGGTTGVVAFYGANDGTYRAVKAETGEELWSFVAPEHFSKLKRLFDDAPPIRFKGDPLTSEPKDYFFDGSTGVFQTFNADGTAATVQIYPSMRRGGRKIYAFDVSNPNPESPSFLWSRGCPGPVGNDTGCDSGFSDIGQTWSEPRGAFIKGYNSGGDPVIIFGGGYDPCEDVDSKSPSCTSPKGSGVYVVDATTGALVKHFSFGTRSVAADVSLIDINQDGLVDYAFAADTGGNIYRMEFVDGANGFAELSESLWTSRRVAFTNDAPDSPRKFLFAPALFQASTDIVYLAIGSGDREHPLLNDYPAVDTTQFNRFYVVKNQLTDLSTEIDLDNETPDANGKNHMLDFTDPQAFLPVDGETTCDIPGVLPTSDEAGWFIDLNPAGEQVVTSAVIVAGSVIFSTNRATPPSTTACTNSLGEALGYNVNLFNASGALGVSGSCGGDRSAEFVGGGLPPSPVIATVPIDGQVHTVVLGAPQKDGTPSSSIEAQKVTLDIPSSRRPVYWFKTGDTD